MYSKALKPEIMRTMLPKGFPPDDLSQPQYGVTVERDVMIPMRDGTLIAANIWKPDKPGKYPAIHAADSYQKDLDHLPSLPIFHMRETNDIDYFVSRGYVFVHTDSRGTGHSPTGQWDLFGQEMQNDLYDKHDRPYYLHDKPQMLEPGRIYKYEIEVWPTSNVFKKGHRIRIDVACGDSPPLDFGGHYYGIKVGTDTYYHDVERPSHIILPAIPA